MANILTIDTGNLFYTGDGTVSDQNANIAQRDILAAANYLKRGDNENALKQFKRALAVDPKNSTALTYIGNINLSLNRNAEAIKSFKQLVTVDPSSADSQVKLGNAYLQDKQYAESEKVFRRAASLDRTNVVPVYTLGQQYLNTGRLKEAEEQLLKAQRLAPADSHVYQALGSLYNKEGKYTEAINVLKTAIRLKSNYPDANYELGVAYYNNGQKQQAQSQLSTLKQSNQTLAADLSLIINKAKISSWDAGDVNFNASLGANSQVWLLDPVNLTAANSSKTFSVKIRFDTGLDAKEAIKTTNWLITKAKGGAGGYYNNSINGNSSGKDAVVSKTPISVAYDPTTRTATLNFSVSQNATGDATIDPKHLVFSYLGNDAYGRKLDPLANEIDAYASGTPF